MNAVNLMKYTVRFNEHSAEDIRLTGGKNSNLAIMINNLSGLDIKIPLGFAITTDAYWTLLKENNLIEKITDQLNSLNKNFDLDKLNRTSKKIRSLIKKAKFPQEILEEIAHQYSWLCTHYKQDNIKVAVRSSATAEDLPNASFAGQQESYVNIAGLEEIIKSTADCMSSLFTPRAIIYRKENDIAEHKVSISVGIQKLVRSDLACSGVVFTLDTESGFKDIIEITSSYGLGENIVSGRVNPDEFDVFKPLLDSKYKPIIKKYLGTKKEKLVFGKSPNETSNLRVNETETNSFSLDDKEILKLAHQAKAIEDFYSKRNNRWTPMDLEWAKDGVDEQIYIVQARPETVYAKKDMSVITTYHVEKASHLKPILTGKSIGNKVATGKVKVLKNIKEMGKFREGDILVTTMTDPDWTPIIKMASAIITDNGGRTCHAAIVSRELRIPALVGTIDATKILKDNQEIALDLSRGQNGYVYNKILKYSTSEIQIRNLPRPSVDLMLNLSEPEQAYRLSFYPVAGVGLARLEFIISNLIKIHPMAIVNFDKLAGNLKTKIEKIAVGYSSPAQFYINTLAQAIATIAASFYPKPVIVRLADFKSNEYRNLIGGQLFELPEENPTIGFRGAVRYCSAAFRDAFALDCVAIKKAREIIGLTNIKIIIPFVRTVYDAECAIKSLKENGLISGHKGLEILMMCEVPSNILALDKFAKLFKSFSIGSNDLTQLVLGADRDSAQLASLFNERDIAVKRIIEIAIDYAKKHNLYLSICGQAPSDYPEFGDFLIKAGINGISLNPDSVIPFLLRIK